MRSRHPDVRGSRVGRLLTKELDRLQGLSLGTALQVVVWQPGSRTDVDAEVVDRCVRIYTADAHAAVLALRHEVIHFEIARTREPFVKVINRLLAGINEDVYRREEELTETLCKLLGD